MQTKHIFYLAIFTYFVLAPFYFHPDLKIIYSLSQFLSQGVTNIYHYTSLHPTSAGPFVYPPLTYFFFGLVYPITSLIAGAGFKSWLAMGNTAVEVPRIFIYLFLTKLPLILLQLASGIMLTKLVAQKNKSKLLFLWLFNPISLYVTVFMGQIDILPTFLTIASLVVSPFWAVIFLGLGGAFKAYPLLLLPLYIKKPKYVLLGIMTYLLTLLPFLATPAFFNDTLLSGLSQRLFQMALAIGFGQSILLLPAAIILIWLYAFKSAKPASSFYLPVLLLILLGIRFNPQWVLWAAPFVCVYIVKTRNWLPGVIFFLGWFGSLVLSPDSFLTWGLLSPLDPGLLTLPPFASLVEPQLLSLLTNMSNTLFAASSVWMILNSHEV